MTIDARAMTAECGLPAALEAVGERWSFLILRGAFHGLCHFEEFQSTLGIARNILSNRLARLVGHGILERRPHCSDRRKVDYHLTEKGRALLPAIIALKQWGERWVTPGPCNPVLVDRLTRQPIDCICVCTADGRRIGVADMIWIDRDELEIIAADAPRPAVQPS